MVLVLLHLAASPFAVLSDPPITFTALFALSVLGALGSAAMVAFAGLSWYEGFWSPLGRLHYALVAISLVSFCWLLWYWRVLMPPG